MWKDIPGQPGYRVSEDGQVKGPKGVRKQSTQSVGYLYVPIKGRNYLVHRLVADVFVPNPEGHPLVLHKDGTRTNNKATNLYWGTQKDNMEDKIRHGRSKEMRRTGPPSNARLNDVKEEVLKDRRGGMSLDRLAEKYHVGRTTIWNMLKGNTWKE